MFFKMVAAKYQPSSSGLNVLNGKSGESHSLGDLMLFGQSLHGPFSSIKKLEPDQDP